MAAFPDARTAASDWHSVAGMVQGSAGRVYRLPDGRTANPEIPDTKLKKTDMIMKGLKPYGTIG